MKSFVFATIIATSTVNTLAAPAGHPSPQVAAEMLAPAKVASPAELPNEGRVISVLQAGEYSYIEVSNGNAMRWLAAPQTILQTGDLIRYEEGATMGSFHSKLLKRNFSNLMFIGQLAIMPGK